MTWKIGDTIPIEYYQGQTGITIHARVVDESGNVHGGELTLVENAALNAAGKPGLYESSFVPDAAGNWKVILYYGTTLYGTTFYDVGGGLSLQEKADVNAELVNEDLDHLLVVAHPTGDPTADSILDLIMNKDVGQNFNRATDSLEAIKDIIGTPAAASIAADLLAIDNFVDELETRLTALRAGYLDELDFDLDARLGAPAGASISADLVTIDNFVDELETRLTAARAGYLDELAAANLPTDVNNVYTRIGAPAGASIAADLVVIDDFVDDLETRLTAARAGYLDNIAATAAGRKQILEVSITSPLNNGITTVATVGSQPVVIESIVLHADTAAHADMTTCAIEGGVGQVVTFISAIDAVEANLDAADKQLFWTGAVRLAVGKIIYIDLQGTGANAADLTVTITYRACADGGILA